MFTCGAVGGATAAEAAKKSTKWTYSSFTYKQTQTYLQMAPFEEPNAFLFIIFIHLADCWYFVLSYATTNNYLIGYSFAHAVRAMKRRTIRTIHANLYRHRICNAHNIQWTNFLPSGTHQTKWMPVNVIANICYSIN